MGPWIILDKNVIQSLPQRAVYELSRYFNTNLTPVLLMETLADLTRDPGDPIQSGKGVEVIAAKAGPINSYPNVDFRQLCVEDLLGNHVPFARRAILGGGQRVELPNGEYGIAFGVTPQNDAIIRWQSGYFLERDVEFAKEWRARIQSTNLEERQKTISKLWEMKLASLDELRSVVDEWVMLPHRQSTMMNDYVKSLQLPTEINAQIYARWKTGAFSSFKQFAPYAFHCFRVEAIFDIGLANRLFGTKRSNFIDMQYLFYVPFCEVFSTGDDFLESFAKLVLEPDQSFVHGVALREELRRLANLRFGTGNDVASNPNGWQMPRVEPDERSIVRQLWIGHRNVFRPQAQPRIPMSPAEEKRLMDELKPIMEAMDKATSSRPARPPWPHEL